MIKFLQDAAGRGDLDPWDIDVISVIDSFLDQFGNNLKDSANNQISFQKDLSETSEALFGASVLVNLKNYIVGALNILSVLFPEKIFVFTEFFTALKSRSTKLLIEAK